MPPDPADWNRQVEEVAKRAERQHLGRMEAAYERVFQRNVRRATRNYRKAAAPARVLTAASGWYYPDPDEVQDINRIIDELRAAGAPLRIQVLTAVMQGLGVRFDLSNPTISRVLDQFGGHITHIAESHRQRIMGAIQDSYDEGLSIPHTAERIRQTGMIDSATRAQAIARTELTAATNGGSWAAANAVGFQYKTWFTAPGAQYPRHEYDPYLRGQTVPISGLFNVRGYRMPSPGIDGPASEVVNCRCTMLYGMQPDGSDTGLSDAYQQGMEPPAAVIPDQWNHFAYDPATDWGSALSSSEEMISKVHTIPSKGLTIESAGEVPRHLWGSSGLSPAAVYHPGSNWMTLGRAASEWHREAYFLHEYGHFLDYQVLGSAEAPLSMRGMQSLMRAITKTPEFAQWGKMGSYGQYLRQTNELWARAYAQFVTKDLPKYIDKNPTAANLLEGGQMQWSAESFKKLAPLVKAILEEAGLI